MPRERNLHATGLVIGDRGILITGPSGSGKTSLALALIRHGLAAGLFARLIADDQVFLAVHDGRIVARAPEAIAGLSEVYGLGPRPLSFEAEALVDLVVVLAEAAQAPRFNENDQEHLPGIALPRIVVPERNEPVAVHAILAATSVSLFPSARETASK